MDANEIVRALRCCANKTENLEGCRTGQPDCPYGTTVIDCAERMHYDAANSIESLQAQLAAYKDTGREPEEIAALDYDAAMLKQSARLANELAIRCNQLQAQIDEWCSGEDQYQQTVERLDCANTRIEELKAQLAASQRREKAAIERLNAKSGGGDKYGDK